MKGFFFFDPVFSLQGRQIWYSPPTYHAYSFSTSFFCVQGHHILHYYHRADLRSFIFKFRASTTTLLFVHSFTINATSKQLGRHACLASEDYV
jgi:hypothetical protein